jgi:hypothetical protein
MQEYLHVQKFQSKLDDNNFVPYCRCHILLFLNDVLNVTNVYFFLVGGCARHLQNPATKCDLPISYGIE